MADHAPAGVVDFHVHYVGPRWPPALWAGVTGELARARARIAERITDIEGVVAAAERGRIATRVLNAPPSLVARPGESLPAEVIRDINTHLAAQVRAHPGQLLGLSGIDAAADGGDRLLDDDVAFAALRSAAVEDTLRRSGRSADEDVAAVAGRNALGLLGAEPVT